MQIEKGKQGKYKKACWNLVSPASISKPVRRLFIWLEGLRPVSKKGRSSPGAFFEPLSQSRLKSQYHEFQYPAGYEGGRPQSLDLSAVPWYGKSWNGIVLTYWGFRKPWIFRFWPSAPCLPGYEKVGAGNLGGSRGLHTAIFYDATRFVIAESGTFWFSATPDIPRSKGWGNIIPRTCTWARLIDQNSRQAFYCYNVHLDHLSQRSRKKSVVFLSRRIQARRFPDPFVLTGDFNAGEENTAIRFLKGNRHLKK